MKHFQAKNSLLLSLFLFIGLFPVTFVQAKSDLQIQNEIKSQIDELLELNGFNIEIQVKKWLVSITGEVQLYEQKLSIDRIVRTIENVIEVDNKVQIIPIFPLSDVNIKKSIQIIIESDESLKLALISIQVNNGKVFLNGSFLNFRDPLRLKSKVATIKGVIDIKINSSFLVVPIRVNKIEYKQQHRIMM